MAGRECVRAVDWPVGDAGRKFQLHLAANARTLHAKF